MSGDASLQSGDAYVGKWPVVKPALSKTAAGGTTFGKGQVWAPMLTWTSYYWGLQNYTIDAFDPAFDGGYNCGADKKSLCYYYIGVHAWCESPDLQPITFSVRATLLRQHADYNVGHYNMKVAAGGQNQYKFCVIDGSDTRADVFTYTDATLCPDSYNKLDISVSRLDPNATTKDLVWRSRAGDLGKSWVDILKSDSDTRAGTYYLNINGHCTPDGDPLCKNGGNCACAPCSNLDRSAYSLKVHDKSVVLAPAEYIGSCKTSNSFQCPGGWSFRPSPIPVKTPTRSPMSPVAKPIMTYTNITLGKPTGPIITKCGQYSYFRVNSKSTPTCSVSVLHPSVDYVLSTIIAHLYSYFSVYSK